jgi:glycerophosphoryl diester phosphodiesterase
VSGSGPSGRAPIGFAHRGARAERRENTLDAFRRALEIGATGLETDAWLTADGVAVLDHDGLTGPRWLGRFRPAISDQARGELPGHIPTLGDLYTECGADFELSVDLKVRDAADAVLAEAGVVGAVDRLWLCHGDGRVLGSWREAARPARLVESTRRGRIPEGLAARAAALQAIGIDALNLPARDWDTEGVAEVHGAGLLAFGWDAQSRRDIDHGLHLGLDALYSDHVGRLMAAINGGPGD